MSHVNYVLENGVASIVVDDGKVNVMNHQLIDEIDVCVDRAIADGAVIALQGRSGIFSAGFDLKVMNGGAEASKALTRAGAQLALKLLICPVPIAALCTGHAYPMGAFLLMASDYRIGIDGDFKLGMNEVAIGITVPMFAIELARYRLTRSYFNRTVMNAEMFTPVESVKAGFLDQVVSADAASAVLLKVAQHLTQLDKGAYQRTKLKAHAGIVESMQKGIQAELV